MVDPGAEAKFWEEVMQIFSEIVGCAIGNKPTCFLVVIALIVSL